MKKRHFFKHFLSDVMIGAVVPTSQFAIKRVCRKVNPRNARVVVEYGPGTGVFSHHLLSVMRDDSKLILVETNPHFCDLLRKIDDPRVHVFEDSAENVRGILEQCGENNADYVISGIPFSLLKEDVRQTVVENTRDALSINGKFLIYQYSMFVKRYLKEHFNSVRVGLAVFNIPPIFIMEGLK